jgi:hypothetical protein
MNAGLAMSTLEPDAAAIESFCSAMFKHAQPRGFVSLRAFRDDGKSDKAIFIEPISIGHPQFIEVVIERVRQAAAWHQPTVFCPPVMTFRTAENAKTENILEGVAISVECDRNPAAALATLRPLLGEPTMASASGGEWQNPDSGEVERKLHLHWRLTRPTETNEDHLRLREARDIATRLVGGDPTAIPLVHPLRWPGSWHRKKEPRLAEIVLQTDNEIGLSTTLDILREVAGSTDPRSGKCSEKLQAANPDDIGKALRVIPNDSVDWAEWNRVGMATWNAAGGSEVGRAAFAEWSAKSKKNDPQATEDRWEHYATSPPASIGFGTLVYLARKHAPNWTTNAATTVEPVDLWAKFNPPSLPRGLLPPIIEDFAFDQGMAMGGDMSGIAMGALAVCAAAIPDKIQLQVKRHNTGWLESARLWVVLVGPVSSMKSPIMSTVVRPLRRIDSEMARNYHRQTSEHNKLSADERKQTEVPKKTRLILQDTTIESAQETLKDSPDGVLVYADELSGWFGSMDKYSGARGSAKDRAFWLESFNGAPYSVSRIGRGDVFIENLSVSVLGGIQPDPIRRLADDSTDDGLLQRLVPIVLRPATIGQDEERSHEVALYSELVGKLHNLGNPMLGGGVSGEIHANLLFDDGAQAIRRELERKHLDLQLCETINRKLAAHIGKYNGLFARLCVIWHCIEHAGARMPLVVPETTARRVAGFMHGFLLPHALAFYAGVLGLSNDHDCLTDIAGYILAHKLDRITNRDVQRGSRSMRNLERRNIESIFDQLSALGWINRVPGPRASDPSHWMVNSVVHQRFAERARSEAERRTRERELISGLMPRGPPREPGDASPLSPLSPG